MEYHVLKRGDKGYPRRLAERLGDKAPERLYFHGPLELLDRLTMATVCSDQSGGKALMATNQLLFTIREYELNYIGGWHSTLETEVFRLGLWRYNHTVTMFTAKGLAHETFESYLRDRFYPPFDKIPERKEYFRRAEEDELLVLSVVEPDVTRTLRPNVVQRNWIACALADFIFIPFAPKGSKTYALAKRIRKAGWPAFTLDDPMCAELHELGVPGFNRKSVAQFLEGFGAKVTTMERKTIAQGPRDFVLQETLPPEKPQNTQGVLPFASDKPASKCHRTRKP